MKGAPERIVERSSTIIINGNDVPLSAEWISSFQKAYDDLGELGERVLGFSDLILPEKEFPIGYQFDATAENFPLDSWFSYYFTVIDV